MFKLLRHFSLTSAVAIAAISLVLVLGYRFIEERNLESQAGDRNVAQAMGLANILLDRHGAHIRHPSTTDPAVLRSLDVTARLEVDVYQIIRNLPVLKLKIYNPSGLAVYSSELAQIGENLRDQSDFKALLASGKPKSKVSRFEFFQAFGEDLRDRSVVESFVPILDDSGRVSAIFAVYSDVSQQVTALDRDTYTMMLLLLGAMVTLYGMLFLVIRNADRILRNQYDELQSFRTDLELKVEARTKTLLDQQSVLSWLARNDEFRTGTLQTAARMLTRTTSQTLGVDRVCLWRCDPDERSVTSLAVYRAPTDDYTAGRSVDMPAYDEFFGRLLRQEIVAADDVVQHPATQCLVETYTAYRGIGAMLAVPIIHGGEVEGVLALEHVGGPFKWTAEHRLFAIAIASFASLAFERQERTRVEVELREAYKSVEAANKAKSLFLANMSHEIRTPMNGVFGMTDLLMRTELTERQTKFVNVISGSAKRLLTIINDILDISRIESGKLDLDTHEFSFRACVEDSVELVAGEAERKGIELDVFIASDVPESVTGDSGRIRQVLTNLVSNAVKFTSAGSVSVRVTSSAGADNVAKLSVEVADTGIGIPADVQKTLFAPFQQADTSISRRFGGTGLGLSISRHLIEMMGGQIRLDSTPGVGTTITFSVPLAINEAASRLVATRKDLDGLRVLVVDDRETNIEVLTSYLSDYGAMPSSATRAAAAFEALCTANEAGEPFDVVLVDMLMPQGNGFEFAHMVRSNPGLSNLRMVLVTSLNWRGDTKVARELGFAAFLSKPVRREDLIKAVRQSVSVGEIAATRPVADVREQDPVPTGFRVLVAEDNPVNVEVAREYLEGMGCEVTCAENGIEAVRAFETGTFDIVLMDCQMPELDGLEATRRIRDIQRQKITRATPIIAITANAYAEDRDLCMEAGMDDYMSKPFSEEQLRRMLARWAPKTVEAGAAASGATSPSGTPAVIVVPEPEQPVSAEGAIEMPVLLQMQKTHATLLSRLLDTYLGYSPKAIQQMMAALEAQDHGQLKITAHSLKSSSANLGAMKLSGLCRDLEHRLKSTEAWDGPAYGAAVMEIENAFFEANAALRQFKESLPPPVAKAARA